jgi:solute carrier family 41
VAIILVANKVNLNPDNLATPFAAALGDIVAISVLAFSASFIYNRLGDL